MVRYVLDTNTVGALIRLNPNVVTALRLVPITSVCISVMTEAELLFGLEKRPEATRLHAAVREFLRRVDVLPFDRPASSVYGALRADLERAGTPVAPLDLLIAAHALSADATLVSNEGAFKNIQSLRLVDWIVAAPMASAPAR